MHPKILLIFECDFKCAILSHTFSFSVLVLCTLDRCKQSHHHISYTLSYYSIPFHLLELSTWTFFVHCASTRQHGVVEQSKCQIGQRRWPKSFFIRQWTNLPNLSLKSSSVGPKVPCTLGESMAYDKSCEKKHTRTKVLKVLLTAAYHSFRRLWHNTICNDKWTE